MDSGQIAPGPLNISDVIEVIANTDPDFVAHNMLDSMEDSRRRSMYVKILEQPASKALRFRYECEGRSAGSIPGVNSTPENKTFPTIQVVGYKGPAVVVVSCVTKDPPYRPHPHNLVGKEGCKKGICTMHISSETMTATFSNLGIQCVKKKDIEEALKVREEIRVDPFRTGFSHRSQPTSIDLNAVRLCFQVFIKDSDSNQFNIPLAPVVSEPIYDKKAMSDLVICKLSDCTCTVAGGKEIILLCEKVAKEDIQVHFFEEKDNQIVWEGLGDFQPTHVHKQVAISFRTPRYKSLEVSGPVKVNIQLRRPSDGATSEPLPFEYLPLDSGRPAFWSLRKALGKKGNYTMFSSILASNTALLTGGTNRATNESSQPSQGSWIQMLESQPGSTSPEISQLSDGVESVKSVGETQVSKAEQENISEIISNKPESNNNDVTIIARDVNKNAYNYAEVNKWAKSESRAVDSNANIQTQLDTEKSVVVDNEEGETCRSLNELLSQVAELDDMYSDTRARLVSTANTDTQANISPVIDTSQSPQIIEMDVEDLYDDDTQTYSSLQLAMKNPIELLDFSSSKYEDVTPQNSNKRDISSSLVPESQDAKLPPLPPKRVRRSPPPPPPARPDHLLINQETSSQAPEKTLPPPPSDTIVPKPSKPSLFQKLFSKKSKSGSKKDGTNTPRGSSMSREGSIGNVSTAASVRRGSEPVIKSGSSPENSPGSPQAELTEAEHYALYTDMAPHATVSEFDEMSFYYSPVEGGNIITPTESPINKMPTNNRDIFT